MLIRSKYPNTVIVISNQSFQFSNYLCEIPDELAIKIISDTANYSVVKKEGIANIYPKFDGQSWLKTKKIIWDGPINYSNGYGKSSMEMIKAINKIADIRPLRGEWHGNSENEIDKELAKICEKPIEKVDSYYIKYYPANVFEPRVAERYIGFTMFEATRIPNGSVAGASDWVSMINNNCERLLVPCTHNKEFFRESGVTRDIGVIPLGIDPALYPEVKQNDDDDFIFGTEGTLTYRKGTDVLVRAFERAFPKRKYPNVKLYIKTQPTGGIVNGWYLNEYVGDERIIMNISILPFKDLYEQFFCKIDCFAFPTRGEGFGLPPMEAMACGLPVICTNWSGTGDFITNENAYPLSYKIVDTPQGDWRGYPSEYRAKGQQWAEPNEDELVDLMRHVYEHREEARQKGKVASKFVKENYSWDDTARKLVEYLDCKF